MTFTLKRIVFLLLFLFLGLPLLLSALLMMAGFSMLSLVLGGGGYFFSEVVPKKKEWNVVNVNGRSSNTNGYRLLVDRQKLLDGRVVSIGTVMSLDELLGTLPGGPGSGSGPGAAESTAPFVANRECQALLETIAEKCVVKSANISVHDAQARLYRVTMKLLFVEKEAFGPVQVEKSLSFVENSIQMQRYGSVSVRIDRRGQFALRRDFYRDAAAACRRVRATSGNCAIQQLKVTTRADQSANMINVAATLDVGMLLPETTLQQAGQRRL
jgi:hypothetical protein